MFSISVKEAEQQLEKAAKDYGPSKVAKALTMALNDGARKGKTEVRRSIQDLYNIKASRINDPNKDKGLSVVIATKNKLTAEIKAGHIPVNLSNLNPRYQGNTVAQQVSFKGGKAKKGQKIKKSRGSISVEIFKGTRKKLATAFVPGIVGGGTISTPAIFARGSKGKPSFLFGKERMPIDTMSSVSVAVAAMNSKAQDKYGDIVSEYTLGRLIKNLNALNGGK